MDIWKKCSNFVGGMKNSLYHLCPLWLLTIVLPIVLLTACSDGTERRLQLEELERQNRADSVMTNDSLATVLVDYFDRHGTPNERMRAHYILGRTYADCGEAPQAIEAYNDAAAAADTTAADCDYHTLTCIYSQMAEVFHQQLLLSFEKEARLKAYHFSCINNDIFGAISEKKLLVGTYIMQNMNDSAEAILHDVMNLYRQQGHEQGALQASMILMYIYISQPGRMEEAKQLMDKFEAGSTLFDENHELPPSKRQYYYYRGSYFEYKGLLDSAEHYYRKVYRPNMDYVDKDPMYRGLLNVFRKRHQADSIAKYSFLYGEANDSSAIKKAQNLTAQLAASYKYNYYQKLAYENSLRTYWTAMLLIILSILFIAVIGWLVWRYRRRGKELKFLQAKLVEEEKKYQEKLASLIQVDDMHKAVNEKLKETSDERVTLNKHHLDTLNNQLQQEKDRLLREAEESKKTINELNRKLSLLRNTKEQSPFFKTDIYQRLFIIEKYNKKQMTDRDWDSLEKAMLKYFPDFIQDLNCANGISVLGRHVCILVALKITPTSICHLLAISKSQVGNLKREINNTLFNEDTARTLYKNLSRHYGIVTT